MQSHFTFLFIQMWYYNISNRWKRSIYFLYCESIPKNGQDLLYIQKCVPGQPGTRLLQCPGARRRDRPARPAGLSGSAASVYISVLLLDGNSEICAHVRSNVCYLFDVRYLITPRAVSEKTYCLSKK